MVKKSFLGFAEGMLVGPSMRKYEAGSRQIDWDKARQIIEERKDILNYVEAGLAEDWEYTAGKVWSKDEGYIPYNDTYVYGASTWATPSLCLYTNNGSELMVECWKLGEDAYDYFDFDGV